MHIFPIKFLDWSIIIVIFAFDKGLHLNSKRKDRVINIIIIGGALTMRKEI